MSPWTPGARVRVVRAPLVDVDGEIPVGAQGTILAVRELRAGYSLRIRWEGLRDRTHRLEEPREPYRGGMYVVSHLLPMWFAHIGQVELIEDEEQRQVGLFGGAS